MQTKILLEEDEMPKRWYNIQADLASPLDPPLHPATGKPVVPSDLSPIFPMELIRQEIHGISQNEFPTASSDEYQDDIEFIGIDSDSDPTLDGPDVSENEPVRSPDDELLLFGHIEDIPHEMDLPDNIDLSEKEIIEQTKDHGEKSSGLDVSRQEFETEPTENQVTVEDHQIDYHSKWMPVKKRYVLIKVIDRKLEQLALDVLKHQSDQLKILERVEEINGLIVDLVT